jgi:Tol biopolymer transport system component
MMRNLKYGFSLLLMTTLMFFSCKKERSCEGCNEYYKPPIAMAGPDQVITLPTDSVLLDGRNSSDPDGTISEWLWTKISGPASFFINNSSASNIAAKNLVEGVYQFELKVTDKRGLPAKDTMQVVVKKPFQSNRPPVANAGADQTVTLPTNTVNLDGSASADPDNNITSYAWTKISGPPSFNIANANAMQTQATNLTAGTYQIELKVTDAGGLISKDTLQIAVNVQPPPPPPCADCKIVFVSDRDGNEEIYSCNADGSDIQRLTNDPATDDQPSWSPDRTRIAFTSDRSGNPELYIMNADGSNVVRKTFSGSYSQNPSWSPDGTKIAYATLSNGSMDIWVLDVNGGSQSLLFAAPGYDDQPAWSPDGTKIVLISDWAAYDFVYDIYTINANGTGFTALTADIFDQFDYLHPSWSPTGTKLAVAISQRIGIDQYNTRIGVMNQDGTGLTSIISGAAPWTRTSWSADGYRIAYTSLVGSRLDVSWVSADGSTWGIIVTNAWNAEWSK